MIEKDVNNVPELLKRLDILSTKGMQIGIFGRDDSEVLLYASVHEFGAKSINVPERSFIRKTFDADQHKMETLIDDMVGKYLDNAIDFETFTSVIGEYLVGLVRLTIKNMKNPPLKQATIDRKGSSGVLVDTGRLIDTITYKVVDISV